MSTLRGRVSTLRPWRMPMLPVIDLRGSDRDPAELLPRASVANLTAARASVRALVADIAERGDHAVAAADRRFDGVQAPPETWRATVEELAAAERALDPGLRAALLDATERVRAFHEAQRPADLVWTGRPGVRLVQRFVPLRRAGVYVPGGRGAYPSSVPAVDSVTGPGNLYVSLAKQEVADRVRTDGFAGPTEIAVVADGGADPGLVAVDLVAQAEHDPLAACLLVTDEPDLWKAVEPILAEEVAAAPRRELVERALAGQSAVVLCDDRDAMLRVVEAFAPEHLELLVEDAAGLAGQVRSAGAVFVGPWTPVALGDYAAGTNHVLPTAGTARFSGGLSTWSFLRPMQVAEFDRAALAAAAPAVAALSGAEELPAHGRAVAVRLPR